MRRGRALVVVVLSLVVAGGARAQTRVFTTGTPEELARASAIGLAHLTAWAAQRGITDELKVTRANVDATKMAHVRVQQFHRGVPVFGGEAIAHLNPTGEPVGQTDNLLAKISVDPTPRLTADAATAGAIAASGCADCARQSTDLWIIRTDGVDHLAFRVQLRQTRGGMPSLPVIFVDAHDGRVLLRYDNLQTAPK